MALYILREILQEISINQKPRIYAKKRRLASLHSPSQKCKSYICTCHL